MSEIAFYQSAKRPTARYVSATTVREEALDHTRLLGLYWSACGQVQRENVTSGLPYRNGWGDGLHPLEVPLHAFELEIDGQSLHNRWDWAGATERPGPRGTREAVVELRHQVRPVGVKVVTRLDDTPFLMRYLEITNTGAIPSALSHVSPLSGMLWSLRDKTDQLSPRIESPFTLGYFDGSSQGTEGNFIWEPLPRGKRRLEYPLGRSGYGGPYFIVRNEVTGECAMGALAWSDSWFMEFWRDPWENLDRIPNRGLNLAFRMGPLGPAPLRVIAPGETVTTPLMHFAMLHAGLDECVAAMHEHLRASVLPPRPEGKAFYSIAGRVIEEPDAWILHEIDIAAEMGAKAFMVDAGWYGNDFSGWWDRRGDWWEGRWLPGGLAACRERAHGHGMLFGLWMEPEAVGPQSELLKRHPDWILRTDDGREVTRYALDLAHPDAAKFLHDEMLRVIRDHQLDFFKIDYNVQTNEGGQCDRDGFVEHEAWRHYETLHATFDEILRDLPHVALENCASGGGRNDLGMLSRTHYAAESDFSDFPRSIRAINALTVFLPPEALAYYHNHMPTAHQMTSLETHLRVAMFAQPIFVGFGAQDVDRTTPYFLMTKRYIQLINEVAAPIVGGKPQVYHHTPAIGTQGPADWCVLEYALPNRLAGYAGLFRLGAKAADEYLFRPRGISLARRYAVTLDNSGETLEMSGIDLHRNGLPVRLDSPNTSELILYRAVEG